MQIGVVAKRIGLSADAIRFHECKGLLPRPPRTAGGFRRYGENDIETLACGASSSCRIGSPAGGIRVKQGTGVSASLAAIVSSLATISCCLPIAFAGSLGAGAASAFATTQRPWLLGLSLVLLGFGFWQQHRAKQCAARGRLVGNVLLCAAVVVVLGMILFPQEIAAVIADRFWK